MPTTEARIETTQAQRYLTQLSDHLGHMSHGGITSRHGQHGGTHEGPAVRQVEHGDRHGEFAFDWGTCTLQALDDALIIRAEGADEEDLTRAQAMIGHRIETIGRREHLPLPGNNKYAADSSKGVQATSGYGSLLLTRVPCCTSALR